MTTYKTLYKLQKAIITNKVVKFNYVNNQGIATTRAVFPYCIYGTHCAVYMIGFCFLRYEKRVFNLDKITYLRILDEDMQDSELIDDKIYTINDRLFTENLDDF